MPTGRLTLSSGNNLAMLQSLPQPGKWYCSPTSLRGEMPASSHFKELLREFNEHQVRYLLVGAYAVMKYTEPRYTKDLDVWVEPTLQNAERVFAALSNFGAPMQRVAVEDF